MLHIHPDESGLHNEADVETKILAPLLVGEQYLGYAASSVYSKDYLAPTALDKTAGKSLG